MSSAISIHTNATMRHPWKGYLYRNAALNTPNNTNANIAFDTVLYDPAGMASGLGTTSAGFLVPVEGYYMMCGQVDWQPTVSPARSLILVTRSPGGGTGTAVEVIRGNDYEANYTANPLSNNLMGVGHLFQNDLVQLNMFASRSDATLTGFTALYLMIHFLSAA